MNIFNNLSHICRRYAGEEKMIGLIGAIRIIGIKNTTPKRTFKAGSATPSKKNEMGAYSNVCNHLIF